MSDNPFVNSQLTPLKVFAMKRYSGDVGIEQEVEGINLPHEIGGWSEHPENSLRGECCEYVTTGAVSLNKIGTHLRTLYDALTAPGRQVRPSPRCSTHIHVNMQDYTWRDFFGYVLFFTVCEPLFLRMCGPERDGNLFCVSSYDTGDLPNFAERLCKQISRGQWNFSGRGKYACLNTDTISKFGSVELRSLPLILNPDDLLPFIRFAVRLRTLAHDYPDIGYEGLIEKAYTDPTAFAIECFDMGIVELSQRTYPGNVSDMIRKGVEVAYEVQRKVSPYLTSTGIRVDKPPKRKKAMPDWWTPDDPLPEPMQHYEEEQP